MTVLYIILIGSGILSIPIGLSTIYLIIRGRRRRVFICDRHPLTDDEFLGDLGISSSLHQICIAVRKSIAGLCGVSPELIKPNDSLEQLFGMMFDGFDEYDLWFSLGVHYSNKNIEAEAVAKVRELTKGLGKPDGLKRFDEFCVEIAKAIGEEEGRGAFSRSCLADD